MQSDKSIQKEAKRLKKVEKITKKLQKTVKLKKPIRKKKVKDISAAVLKNVNRMKTMKTKYYASLLDPWSAFGVKLPRIGDNYSNTAKVVSYFSLTANATGYFFLYFDPNYITGATSPYTSFTYNNSTSLNSVTAVTGSSYSAGGLGSVPIPPTNTVLKTRLVSAGMKVVPKTSVLNFVATALACVDYGDYDLHTVGATLFAAQANVSQYTNFSYIRQTNGGTKYDLSPENNAVYYNWYPTDPLSDVFIDVGNYIVDNQAKDAGGSPRFILGLQDLPANCPIDIEIVWNIEYLANAQMKPWLGHQSESPTNVQYLDARDKLSQDPLVMDLREKDQMVKELSKLPGIHKMPLGGKP